MGLLNYTKCLVFPKVNQITAKDILNRLAFAIGAKRMGDIKQLGDRLQFRNLYLKRLDLLPIPQGWIQVREGQGEFQITFAVDYGWHINKRGRLLAIWSGLVMATVTLYKSKEFHRLEGALPSPWFFLVIPLYVYLLWLFVFGLNSWYSRLYLTRLIRSMVAW